MTRTGFLGGFSVLAVVVAACMVVVASIPGRESGAQTELVPHTDAPASAPASGSVAPPARTSLSGSAPRTTASTLAATEVLGLEAAVRDAIGETDVEVSVVVRRLTDGSSLSIGGDRVYYAASLYKLAILYEAALRISSGEVTLDDLVPLSAEDFAEDLGTAGTLPLDEDGQISMAAALEAMVIHSDNVTAVALRKFFGGAAIDATLAGIGLRDTSLNDRALPTTADDMARLMEAVVAGEGLDRESRDFAVSLLMRQEMREAALAGLPEGIAAGSKWGAWPEDGGAGHDVAFVDAPGGTYVIAVLTDQPWAWDLIAEISRAVYLVLR